MRRDLIRHGFRRFGDGLRCGLFDLNCGLYFRLTYCRVVRLLRCLHLRLFDVQGHGDILAGATGANNRTECVVQLDLLVPGIQ